MDDSFENRILPHLRMLLPDGGKGESGLQHDNAFSFFVVPLASGVGNYPKNRVMSIPAKGGIQ
jgi:hypothetical protein